MAARDYFDAFTTASTWTGTMFADECAAHGIAPTEDEGFAGTASRLWEVYSSDERDQFKSDYDDWCDA